jgi:hypothetical protein
MNLFRSEEHARRWDKFNPASEAGLGFIGLDDLVAFFGTESRRHMLELDYLSTWYPRRAGERRAVLERAGKTTPFWLGTPGTP